MHDNPYAAPQSSVVPPLPQENLPLASRWARLGGNILDGLILGAINVVLMFASGAWGRIAQAQREHGIFAIVAESYLWAALGIVLFIAINWKFLGNGQSIGKLAVSAQIRLMDGAIPSRQHILVRRYLPMWLAGWIPLPYAVLAVSLIDALFIFRENKRTLHDEIAGTKVVVAPHYPHPARGA
jgi:uncharacterized RDD family membrane protein YckC